MKKHFSALLVFLIAMFAIPQAAHATQTWNFTSNSNPKKVEINANQITIGSKSSTDWGVWIGETELQWDATNKCWYTILTTNTTGFDFVLKCTNTSNGSYYYKGANFSYSNAKASYEYIINENDGNGSGNSYVGGLTSGTKYILKISAHPGVTKCADLLIEPYTEPSTGGNEGGNQGGTTADASNLVSLMGIGGDWTTGISVNRSEVVDNQAHFTVENWAEGTEFKFRIYNTWYGHDYNHTYIANGAWYNYSSSSAGEDANFTLPASANGRTVTFSVATDNGHFKASWTTTDVTSTAATYPGGVPKPGVVFNDNGTATFCLPAPDRTAVSVSGSWNDYASSTLMNYQDYNGYRYFWTTISGINKTDWYTYFYTVEGIYNVCDPYSPVILDPEYDSDINSGAWNNGADIPPYPTAAGALKAYPDEEQAYKGTEGIPSQNVRVSAVKGNLQDYDWTVTDFTPVDRGIMNIYELHVGDFNGTNGQRYGEGSFKKAQARLDYLKDLGINMIELMPVMEFNMNHNWGYDTNSHFAVDKQYGTPADLKDFIDACHAKGIGVILDIVFNHVTDLHPWKMMYAPGASPFFNATAPHNYSVHNDFNQNYSFIEPYYMDVLTYWLTNYKVDGFRFDLVKGLANNEDYNGNYDGAYELPSLVARMKRIHAHMKTIHPTVMHVNEAFLNYNDEVKLNADGQLVWLHQCHEAQEYVAGEHLQNKFGNLDHVTAEANGRGSFGSINYAESHDEPWLGYIAKTTSNTNISGSLQSRMNRLASYAAQMFIAHGPKMLFQFCELGYDIEALADRGYARIGPKEVHWEFADVAERQTLRNVYKAIMGLRNANPDLFAAGVSPQFKGFGDNENARVVRIDAGDKELLLFVNPSTHATASYQVNDNPKIWSGNYKVVTATAGYTPTVTSDYGWVKVSDIPANGFCLLASTNVTDPGESSTTDPDPTYPDYYLVGSQLGANGTAVWVDNEDLKFTHVSGTTYTISLATLSGEFKVKEAGTWDTSLGAATYDNTNSRPNVFITPGETFSATYGSGSKNIGVNGTLENVTITIDVAATARTILLSVQEYTRIALGQTEAELDVDDTLTLTYTVTPEGAEIPAVTWSSSNEDVATVSATGVVTAVAPGVTTITLAAGSDLTATCEVTVYGTYTIFYNNGRTAWTTVSAAISDDVETETIELTAPATGADIWTATVRRSWTPTTISFTNGSDSTEAQAFVSGTVYGRSARSEFDINDDGYVDMQDILDLLILIHTQGVHHNN